MKKVLVIEDEQQIRSNIIEILHYLDYDTISADNGLIGLEMAREQLPDLIICDIMMPQLDGYSVVTSLREDEKTAKIPFIFLTAKNEYTDLRKGMELGADDYLIKPFTSDEIMRSVNRQMEKMAVFERYTQSKLNTLSNNISMSLSQEMNSSLNGILGVSQMLLRSHNLLNNMEAIEMVECIYNTALRLNKLVQNCLIYTELELAATEPEKILDTRLNIPRSFTQEIINQVAWEKANQVERIEDLNIEIENTLVQIPADKLQKIAEEIIDNAFKFSRRHTTVKIIGSVSENHFNLFVIDGGRGITSEEIADIGAYMQFSRKFSEQQGSGLGLIIAKKLVELYGGQFNIESIPGKQTIVHIMLPQVTVRSIDMDIPWQSIPAS
ncbi:response regulator [Sphaerospermopsis aphanizomenoides BCCUSP55]|uniref:hybrid sensor histidine kinase/response regulator n=1 Tax=Sphaerospermopsis aphanizomenoides TaxID=459663 RepID=UPI0019074675|nr:response regulator [Sphaerospermopsis aphanizomenoides]MBK1990065.1 response regulator [Sphaerospermopsis aphanizomenoides BCCUSP55]